MVFDWVVFEVNVYARDRLVLRNFLLVDSIPFSITVSRKVYQIFRQHVPGGNSPGFIPVQGWTTLLLGFVVDLLSVDLEKQFYAI